MTEDEPDPVERVSYWYDSSTHGFVGPVSWAMIVDGRPIDGYSIVSPKGPNTDVYGRTDEIGEQILSEYSDTGKSITYAINDAHNLSRGHVSAPARDVMVRGRTAELEAVSKSKHHGKGKITDLETGRASPNPDFIRDRFDRAFALRVNGKEKQFAMKPKHG